MTTYTYEGLLSIHNVGDSSNVLFLSSMKDPLTDELSWISGTQVTIRYWVSDKQVTKDEANDTFMQICMGGSRVRFSAHYSELTGYLWTDEDLIVGGHDLLDELKSYEGKWLIMEVDT